MEPTLERPTDRRVGAKTYLLVGGSSGMAKETADRLDGRGHRLEIATRGGGPARASAEPGARVHRQWFDASAPGAELELPDVLDGLVYFPGTITLKPFARLTPDDLSNDLEVNYLGAVRVLQQACASLKRAEDGASVVLFSSVAASVGMGYHASIASAKAAVEGLTRSLAAEWAPNIRVNAIAPSLTDTPLAARFLSSEDKIVAAARRHPVQQIGDPGDVAAMVEFLLGDASRFITGQVLRPDGGLSSLRPL